jgi:hypothetical protein
MPRGSLHWAACSSPALARGAAETDIDSACPEVEIIIFRTSHPGYGYPSARTFSREPSYP